MEYFYSNDPEDIEKEKKKQECYNNYLPILMGNKDDTIYILLDNKEKKNEPNDKLASKKQNIYNKAKVLAKEIGFAVRHPNVALNIGTGVVHNSTNISTKATRFATKGPILYGAGTDEQDPGTENGAFRHTLWQAEIASRYGEKIARRAGNAHEIEPNADLNNRHFNHLENADQTTDLLNNQIGRKIGIQHPNKNTKELAFIILEEFKNNGLFVSEQDEDGVWTVKKKLLSEDKYNNLKNIYNNLNEDGFTEEQILEFEENINKDGRKFKGLDILWRTIR